ncbi:hypothetical protein HELRODRAFT_183349 [Helobdella robusta]|uniref:Uncharacterized protein n=1 Tax=Helobdella robusta TaxID=6412 RepID=T1FJH7_HELRO|nr:hypothetical protein HELRODRAFT_183349 [Helobdella robusta]ESO11244.1 hypothetical protein HELRODRAFT_183349 [Helobdella robusta]
MIKVRNIMVSRFPRTNSTDLVQLVVSMKLFRVFELNRKMLPRYFKLPNITILAIVLLTLGSTLLREVNAEKMEPPVKPAEFTSAEEIRKYVKALEDYYFYHGRPRFGKRNYANELESVLGSKCDIEIHPHLKHLQKLQPADETVRYVLVPAEFYLFRNVLAPTGGLQNNFITHCHFFYSE